MTPYSKRTGSFKSFDGTRIYYEVRGDGEPLVFAYGIGCLMNHWRHQVKYFSNQYQTILFDYRAHHMSELPKDRGSLTVDSLALDMLALMDHLQITRASFFGHSFGAQVLTRAYDMKPDYFKKMVFINGFASNPIRGMYGNDWAVKAFDWVKLTYSLLPETSAYLWKAAITNPLAVHTSALLGGFNLRLTQLKDIEIYARGIASIDVDAFIRLFEAMMDYDGRPVLPRVECPTLILGGQKDSITPLSYQEDMYKKIRNSRLIMIPYGSHCTQLDMPDYVNLKIEDFLQ